jgi:hypothetical protein
MTTPVDSARNFYDSLGSGFSPPSAIARIRAPTNNLGINRSPRGTGAAVLDVTSNGGAGFVGDEA